MPSLLRAHLPLAALASGFLALVSVTQCTSTRGDEPGTQPPDAGGQGIDAADDASRRACAIDNDCTLPVSSCQSTTELVYYTDPKCVQSQCQWTRQSRTCPCFNGGCNVTTTTGGFPGTGGAGGMPNATDAAPDHATIDPPDGGVCDVDASDGAGACALPPSVCVDSRWLAYFVNPVCGATARCEWEVRYRRCEVCVGSGCITNTTAYMPRRYQRTRNRLGL